MFERWLDAREAEDVRREWRALSPRRQELAHPHRKTTRHGCALLAQAMLGERADWLLDVEHGKTKPDKEAGGERHGTFLDDALDTSALYSQRWEIFERIQRDDARGIRGVQCIKLEISVTHPPYEGGVFYVVRIVDRDRAVSVPLNENHASTIGDVDLAPLDLYDFSRGCEPHVPLDDVSTQPRLLASARALVARLATVLDARFEAGATWPRIADAPPRPWASDPPRIADEGVYGDGACGIEAVLDEPNLGPHARASVQGLPWGHELQLTMRPHSHGISGYLIVRLPNGSIDKVLAQLATFATLR